MIVVGTPISNSDNVFSSLYFQHDTTNQQQHPTPQPGQLWTWKFKQGIWPLSIVTDQARRELCLDVAYINDGDFFLIVTINDEGPYDISLDLQSGSKKYITQLYFVTGLSGSETMIFVFVS